jgi:hypothetical protein
MNTIILGAGILQGHVVEIMRQAEVLNGQLEFNVTIQQSMINLTSRMIYHARPESGLCDKCGGIGTVKLLPPGH